MGLKMGSMSRKMRRKKQKKGKKAAKKKLSKIAWALAAMPESCSACDKKVDKASMGTQLDWYVEIDNGGSMKLTCPECRGEK